MGKDVVASDAEWLKGGDPEVAQPFLAGWAVGEGAGEPRYPIPSLLLGLRSFSFLLTEAGGVALTCLSPYLLSLLSKTTSPLP